MNEISLQHARQAIQATFEKGGEIGLKPLTAVVLDAGGHVKAFERQDGASPGRFQVAFGKAYGAVMLGMPGRAQMERAESQPYFMTAMNGAFDGRVVPVPGGILVRNGDGAVIGALGVTGDTSDNDVEAGLAGLAAAGLDGEA